MGQALECQQKNIITHPPTQLFRLSFFLTVDILVRVMYKEHQYGFVVVPYYVQE